MHMSRKIYSDKTVFAKIVKMLTTKNRQMKKKIKTIAKGPSKKPQNRGKKRCNTLQNYKA